MMIAGSLNLNCMFIFKVKRSALKTNSCSAWKGFNAFTRKSCALSAEKMSKVITLSVFLQVEFLHRLLQGHPPKL